MTRDQARESARDILEIIPLVMRTVAAELRAAGEMPAPAHFGLLSILSDAAADADRAGVAARCQPAVDVDVHYRDGGARVGAPAALPRTTGAW